MNQPKQRAKVVRRRGKSPCSQNTQYPAGFVAAVDVIADNCGEKARALILSGRSRLTPKDVGTISRMAPDRQRYEMGEVAEGRRPFQKPKHGEPPLDTVNFKEVFSRLARAKGLIEKNVRDLPRLPADVRPTQDEMKGIQAKLRGIAEDAGVLLRFVEAFK